MLYKITDVRDNQFSYILSTKYSLLLLKLMRLWCTYKCMQLAFCFVLFSFCFLMITYDCKCRDNEVRDILHVNVVTRTSRTLCNNSQWSGISKFLQCLSRFQKIYSQLDMSRESRCYGFLTSVAEIAGFTV